MNLENMMGGSSLIQGTPTIQSNPFSIAGIDSSLRDTTYLIHQPNEYSDKYFQVAPVGYSIENPVNVKYNAPSQNGFFATPTVKNSNSPSKRCTK